MSEPNAQPSTQTLRRGRGRPRPHGAVVRALSAAHGWKIRGDRQSRAAARARAPARARSGDPGRTGGFDARLLDDALCVVASPGVSLDEPFFVQARTRGLEIVGDIELFARAVDAPVVGITGTNGKSTVTTLVGAHGRARRHARCASAAISVEPALDLLRARRDADRALRAGAVELPARDHAARCTLKAAAVLNVTAGSHGSLRDASRTTPPPRRASSPAANRGDQCRRSAGACACRGRGSACSRFSLRATIGADYRGRGAGDGDWWLMRRGDAAAAACPQLKITGLHNAANALAALALGDALRLADARHARRAARVHRACRIARSGSPTSTACATSTIRRAPTSARRSPRSAGMRGPAGGDRRRRRQGPGLHAAGATRFAARCGTPC